MRKRNITWESACFDWFNLFFFVVVPLPFGPVFVECFGHIQFNIVAFLLTVWFERM